MRIRKRPVPFPLSSLSPIPLSDPQLKRSPVVQHHRQESIQPYPDGNLSVQEDNTCYQPSDPPNQRPFTSHSDLRLMIGRGRTGWFCSDKEQKEKKRKECLELQGKEVEDERWREGEKSNDIRKGSILGAEAGTGVNLPLSSSSNQAVGRWCEGDKAVPLKKRRGSFERRVSEEMIMEKEKKMKAKMKTKMNKKCVSQNGTDEQEEREAKEGFDTASVKKRGRGGALMEGSRCSRVNGRGWRCCQQTLVGYSLCEHHLGKGRLRSMTSVRSRAMAATTTPKKDDAEELSSFSSSLREKQRERNLLDDDDDDVEEEEDEKKPLMIRKKRMKIGMVKARSLSSLLGQTNNAIAVADNNKYGNV